MFPIKSWLIWAMDISKRLCSLGAPGIFVFCYKLFNLTWLPLFIEFKAFTAESLLTSGHHATCTVALCGLSFYATVKGKQTYSTYAALKRLVHRQNQPDLRPHLRGGQSWWLYRTVWLMRKISVVVFCWRWKTERVFFRGNVYSCFYK